MKKTIFVFEHKGDNKFYKKLNGKKCIILKALTSKECDIPDVGFMYRIQFKNKLVVDAFSDELINPKTIEVIKIPNNIAKLLKFFYHTKVNKNLIGEWKSWYIFNKKIKTNLLCLYRYI